MSGRDRASAAGLSPPPVLGDAARDEWRRVVALLARAGTLSDLDRAVLAGYCQAWAAWSEAEAKLAEFGRVVRSDRGPAVLSPYLAVADKAFQQMLRAATELGMTPAVRSRVKPAAPGCRPGIPLDDDLDQAFGPLAFDA